MKLLSLWFMLALSIFGSSYTIEDLIVLEQGKHYKEFLTHAHDIRPSQRDGAWQKMIEHMGTGFIEKLILEKSFDDPSFEFIQQISRWEELKKDAYFHSKRDIYMIKYLQYCLKNQSFEGCHKQAKKIWDIGIKNRDTGILIAELLAEQSQNSDTFYFTQEAVHSSFGEFYCRKTFLQKALYGKVYREGFDKEEPHNLASLIDGTMGKECFGVFANILLKELESTRKISRDFAYKVLSAKKHLPPDEEDYYLVRFLLDSPKKGRTFNLAWAKLKEIAENYERRKRLIKKLKTLDPLPDSVFASADRLKSRTMARYFYQTIPEYMNHYVKTCLAYIGGKGHHPNGNPTVHCDTFFETTKPNELPEQEIRLRYSGLRKFTTQKTDI